VKKSTSTALLAEFEALQARFAHRIATRLTEHAAVQPHEIGERLRVARERALDRARAVRHVNAAAPAVIGVSAGAAVLGADPAEGGWGFKLASVVPLYRHRPFGIDGTRGPRSTPPPTSTPYG
jgi:hypothetical protein